MPLETLLLAKKLIDHAKEVHEFLKNGLLEILNEVGHAAYSAAKTNLENAKISTDPQREIVLAVGHLQQAFELYHRTATDSSFKSVLHDLGTSLTFRGELRRERGYQAACDTALVLCRCYRDLSDLPLCKKYARLALECFVGYANAVLDSVRQNANDSRVPKRCRELAEELFRCISVCAELTGQPVNPTAQAIIGRWERSIGDTRYILDFHPDGRCLYPEFTFFGQPKLKELRYRAIGTHELQFIWRAMFREQHTDVPLAAFADDLFHADYGIIHIYSRTSNTSSMT